jgi:hypothetical protein
MTFIDLAVFASIAAGVVCWALGEALRSRNFWTAGAILTLIHSIAAFGLFYGWNHETARLLTAQQSAALTGIAFAGAIHVNYAFLAVWLGDASWWWMSPGTYRERPRSVSLIVRGFIFFIIINGAVVFADGWARLVGSASTSLVLASWFLKLWSRRGASTTAGSF